MIFIKISDMDFYDDANILVKSFYPRTEVTSKFCEDVELTIEIETPIKDGRSKKELHDEFKDKLYLQLVKLTGNTLPWGNVTGVRPSKVAVSMFENGESEETIRRYFKEEHYVDDSKINLAIQVAKKELELLNNIDYIKGYSLYIGIPFCPTTCLYCSFTSYSLALWKNQVDHYLDALIKELDFVARSMGNRRLDTIYFGGGTPTTLTPEQLDRLLTAVDEKFDLKHVYELTVEAGRPDSITLEKLLILKSHNVSRISINPQTMNQETLDVIGRRHTVEQVIDAYHMARNNGFTNINMDLILGLPGEDKALVQNTLEQIKQLAPESLTIHSLAIKRAAKINILRDKYKDVELINTDEIIQMATDYALDMGLEPYYMYRQKNIAGNFENVGYSKPGKECIYNVLIMEEKQTIIAVGAGASSKILFYSEDGTYDRVERIENVKDVRNYIDRIDEMIDRKYKFFTENKF